MGINEGITWVQMPDNVWVRCCGTMGDMGDLFDMLEVGEIGGTGGQTWGRSGTWGLRVGSRTHFSVGHLGKSGSLKRQVLEILGCLGLGTDDFGCLIRKWKSGFIRGLGMRDLGLWIGGWVFGFEKLDLGIWGVKRF